MSTTLILPAAPAPPAPAAPQAASPAREAPEVQAGASFKKALAAARKADTEKSADLSAQSEPDAKPVEASPADDADKNMPLKQALLAAMAAMAALVNSTAPAQALAGMNGAEPVVATQPPADIAAALALQAETVTAAEDLPQPAAPVKTEVAQDAKAAQFAELLKAQAKPEAEAKVAAEAKPAAPTPALDTAQPLITVVDGSKLAAAKSALEALGDQLKPEVEKPRVAAAKTVVQPLDPGLVKAATPFNINELARLSEARPNNPLPLVAQIQQGIETLSKSGQTSLRLQTDPEALGRVDLRLTSSAEGVRVSITADLSATGSLLERHAQELRQALSDSGLTVAGMSIGFSLGQGKSSTAFEWQPPASGRTSTSSLEATLEPDLDQGVPLRMSDAGRVDYRI